MKDKENNYSPKGQNNHVFWKTFFFSGLVFLIVGFVLIHSGVFQRGISIPELKTVQNTQDRAYDSDMLCQQINDLDIGYQEDCNRFMLQYMELLEFKIDSDFVKAKKSIPEVIDQLTGLNVCVKFCYKAAKDKLKGTNDFEEAYMDIINQPIVQPCLHANALASETLKTLDQHLKERYAQYAMDLAVVCGDTGEEVSSPDVERLLQCINTVAASSSQFQQEKIFALVGVAFEAIFIRSTCNAIVKLFAGPVAKICSSLGVGGICAAADGPFPVGDAIGGVLAVGGLAWTAYDIYDVTCVLPEKLKTELETGITETQEKLMDDSKNKARELLEIYQNCGSTLKTELIKEIN